jgi:hypothetical protein
MRKWLPVHLHDSQSSASDLLSGSMVTDSYCAGIFQPVQSAGTGKSQVLKAIIEFFKRRNEEYRYLVLDPTGSTAALRNGSTYHSVFQIPRDSKRKNHNDIEGIRNEGTALAAVNEIQGVDYVFLDEISMVSCNDLQLLATQGGQGKKYSRGLLWFFESGGRRRLCSAFSHGWTMTVQRKTQWINAPRMRYSVKYCASVQHRGHPH